MELSMVYVRKEEVFWTIIDCRGGRVLGGKCVAGFFWVPTYFRPGIMTRIIIKLFRFNKILKTILTPRSNKLIFWSHRRPQRRLSRLAKNLTTLCLCIWLIFSL